MNRTIPSSFSPEQTEKFNYIKKRYKVVSALYFAPYLVMALSYCLFVAFPFFAISPDILASISEYVGYLSPSLSAYLKEVYRQNGAAEASIMSNAILASLAVSVLLVPEMTKILVKTDAHYLVFVQQKRGKKNYDPYIQSIVSIFGFIAILAIFAIVMTDVDLFWKNSGRPSRLAVAGVPLLFPSTLIIFYMILLSLKIVISEVKLSK